MKFNKFKSSYVNIYLNYQSNLKIDENNFKIIPFKVNESIF